MPFCKTFAFSGGEPDFETAPAGLSLPRNPAGKKGRCPGRKPVRTGLGQTDERGAMDALMGIFGLRRK